MDKIILSLLCLAMIGLELGCRKKEEAKLELPHERMLSDTITELEHQYELPKGVLSAIALVESGFDETAMRDEESLRRRGWRLRERTAYGLTQVVYGMHRKTCRLISPAELLDGHANLRCAALVLDNCMDRSGRNLTAALSCYNGDRSGRYARKVMTELKRFS